MIDGPFMGEVGTAGTGGDREWNTVMGTFDRHEGVPLVTRVSSWFSPGVFSEALWRYPPLGRRRFATVTAVFIETVFQLGYAFAQGLDLFLESQNNIDQGFRIGPCN